MDSIMIEGGFRLQGEIPIQGSKNAVLPIMAASILNSGLSVIYNCPKISDVWDMIELLKDIGCSVVFEEDTLIINSKNAYKTEISSRVTEKLRGSVVLLGPLLARFGQGKINKPGGCKIGSRPINIHLDAFKEMNVVCEETNEMVFVKATKLMGAKIYLSYPSVGATQNAVMAAVLGDGVTHLYNCATEPEVVELCHFLRGMGAIILGIGSEHLEITGVKDLKDTEYRIGPDRIVIGTYLCACLLAGGEVTLKDCNISHGVGYIDVLCGMGASISSYDNSIVMKMNKTIEPINFIKTSPFPGFPTDMQSIVMSVLSRANGTSIIKERIFNNRMGLAEELNKMGGQVSVCGNEAIITGVKELHGTVVTAKDLRGGAALVVAGLGASGITTIDNVLYINRGYVDICRDLKKLGANIKWIKKEEENEKKHLQSWDFSLAF